MGNVSFNWNINNPALRAPVVLELESSDSAFLDDSHPTFEAVFGYITEIMTKAYEYGFYAYAK